MPESIRAACIQLNSGDRQDDNLERTAQLIARAASQGCSLLLLPENFSFMGGKERDKLAIAENRDDSSTIRFLANQAKEHGINIVGGTLPLQTGDVGKVRNSCPVLSDTGELIACYDKMHLFDVSLPDESYRESDTVEAGATPESVDIGDWKAGLSVCYDLRFPELYRHYSSIGCNILTVPAAFTVPTGRAHWETLLRARAIENQAYVLAAGQCGTHPGGRKTWGHSMIIDPWGDVVATLSDEEGIITAELSLGSLSRIREALPALNHRRL